MNKLLFVLTSLLLISCGQKDYPLLYKIEKLKQSKDAIDTNFESLFEHMSLLTEISKAEIPRGVQAPASIKCEDFVLSNEQVLTIKKECISGFFDICPRGFEKYEILATKFVSTCQRLKEK